MPVKIQKKQKRKVENTEFQNESTELQDHLSQETSPTIQTNQPSSSADQAQGNLDLSNFLAQMTQMMGQQNEMMKMMDERMKKLEEGNAQKTVEGEIIKEPEVVVPLNEDNVASYNREDEDYAEVVNRVWKIMYITAQAPVTRGMQDAVPMMETVNERRRVGNMVVSDTKYFNSEDEAKAYLENLRQKGTILPGAKIISCYI